MLHPQCSTDPHLLLFLLIGNSLIALAYYIMPFFLWRLMRHIGVGLFGLFGAFIFLCGTTHVLEIIGNFYPVYWLQIVTTWATGFVSLATVIVFVPKALKLLTVISPDERIQALREFLESR